MKVSLNWLSEFADIKLDPNELVEKIGAQLGAVEGVENYGEKYQGIVVARVVSCDKHPSADKLSLCFIDDGGKVPDVPRAGNGFVQVVCGAPNVKAGMLVAWLPPGSTVPNSFDKDPFVLTSREIRGQLSHGMLASAHELGFGDDHDGIVEVELKANPGDDFVVVYKLNDYIIDIENKMFTHRPDCFGMIGVAREVAGIQGLAFKSPDWYKADPEPISPPQNSLELEVMNLIPEAVPRLCAAAVSGLSIKPSPLYMQTMLSRVGIRPINNVVDITNLAMVLSGQPLHAFDYDKVKALSPPGEPARLVARWPNPGESLKLLNGKTIKLEGQTIVISSGTIPIALGGVMGGADTEVDSSTKNIILECANFDMYTVRRSTMQYGIFSDAATRFNKGQSPLQNMAVLQRAVTLAGQIAGGQLANKLFDEKSDLKAWPPVSTSVSYINQRLGLDLDSTTISNLLSNVEFGVTINESELTFAPPFWRTDIAIPEDIVEEVGRLYGYDKLPLALPRKDLASADQEPQLKLKAELRQLLASAGGNECLSYSFVNSKLMSAAGQDAAAAYHIRNALSPDLQYYRQSLTPSLLDKVHPNVKTGIAQFVIFELGTAHHKSAADEDGLPKELPRLSLVAAANDKLAKTLKGAAFYAAKDYCQLLADKLGLNLSYLPLQDSLDELSPAWQATAAAYEKNRSALVLCGSEVAGLVGEPTAVMRAALKLPKLCAAAELDTGVLLANKTDLSYSPLNRFPASNQDITLVVGVTTPYAELHNVLDESLGQAAAEHGYSYRLTTLGIFKPGPASDKKNVTFQLSLEHPARTLTTAEVSQIVVELVANAKNNLGAVQV